MKEILLNINDYLTIILALLISILSILEKSKSISKKPLSKLIKFLNGNLTEKVDRITQKIEFVEKKVDENEKDRIKQEILSFSNSLRKGEPHTREEFMHIFDIYEKYKKLGGNSFVQMEIEFIHECYIMLSKTLHHNKNAL